MHISKSIKSTESTSNTEHIWPQFPSSSHSYWPSELECFWPLPHPTSEVMFPPSLFRIDEDNYDDDRLNISQCCHFQRRRSLYPAPPLWPTEEMPGKPIDQGKGCSQMASCGKREGDVGQKVISLARGGGGGHYI